MLSLCSYLSERQYAIKNKVSILFEKKTTVSEQFHYILDGKAV